MLLCKLSLFCALLHSVTSSNRIARKTEIISNCEVEYSITECVDEEFKKPFLRSILNIFSVFWKSDCQFDKITYQWVSAINGQAKTLSDQDKLEIKPYTFTEKGQHLIELQISVTKDQQTHPLPDACSFDVVSEEPIPVIEGGAEKSVQAGKSFTVDGSKSIDKNVAPDKTSNMKYKWTCVVTQGAIKDFCESNTFSTSSITVPATKSIEDYIYFFSLEIESEDKKADANQTVLILRNAIEMEIVCEKNCLPASEITDPKSVTILKIKCLTNCQFFEKRNFEWTVTNQVFDYDKNTVSGRNLKKFIIKPDILKPGLEYEIKVATKEQSPSTSLKHIKAHIPPKIASCNIIPEKGEAMKTSFKATCNFTGEIVLFEIITLEFLTSNPIVIARSAVLSNLQFILPANVQVFIKIIDEFELEDTQTVKVQVEPVIDPNDSQETIEAKIKDLFDSLTNFVENRQFEAASQVMNVLYEEVKAKKDELPSMFNKTKIDILDNLKDFPMDSQEEALNVASMVTKIVKDSLRKSNPNLGKIVTEMCKKAAGIILEDVRKTHFPKSETSFAKEASSVLMSCCETDTQPNYQELISEPVVNITTPYPLLTESDMITEMYADYVDDKELNKTKLYEEAAKNFVTICQTNLESLALTAGEGENTLSSITEFCSVSVTKDTGEELVKKIIKDRGVEVLVSKDFKKVSDIVDVMLCTWQKDPFWWNPEKQIVSTNVVLLKFQEANGTKEFKEFSSPFTITLNISGKFKIDKHKVEFPTKESSTDKDISVIRILARKNEAFFVKFSLGNQDNFDVIITDNFKPRVAEIHDYGVTVSKNNNSVYLENDKDHDTRYYVSVLPNKKMGSSFDEKLTYFVSVYTLSCYTWKGDQKKWIFACKGAATSDAEKIECNCHHLSIFSGMAFNNEIKIEDNLNENFLLTLLSYPIVSIYVTLIVKVYCSLILFGSYKFKSYGLYFLGDNKRTERYIYILMVKTGKRLSAGTSSKICVKLFGAKSESKGHVLNFPDPEDRLLQTGDTDWFILTSENFLGDVKSISLWTDCSGRDSSWFCNEIVVYDLQTKRFWPFVIKQWLDLPPSGETYIKKEVTEDVEDAEKESKNVDKFLTKFNLQRSCLGITFFAKMTVFLSAILTIFGISMIMYGLPRLRIYDSFTRFYFPQFYAEVPLIAFLSSLASFVFHIIFITIFKNSATETDTEDKTFSFKIRVCCWILLSLNIVFWLSFLLIFGFWLPKTTNWLWIISTVGGFLVYFLIFHNVYERVLNLKYYTHEKINTIWDRLENIVEVAEEQRQHLFRSFGESLLRPYLTHLYKKLDEDDIRERQSRRFYRLQLLTIIEDIIMFTFYIVLLYLTVYVQKEALTVDNREEIVSLLQGELTKTSSYEDVETIDDIYDYINDTVIPSTQSPVWYGRYILKDPGMMIDFSNKYLGVVRIRQKRIIKETCTLPRGLFSLFKNSTCAREYYIAEHDIGHFGPKGTSQDRLGSIWNYTEVHSAGYNLVFGKFGTYFGGGFVAPLGRTLYNSYVNFDYLKKREWLDDKTRAVFIEFLAYNVNTNLFTSSRVIFEISATGLIRSFAEVKSSRLVFVNNENKVIEFFIFVGFVIVVAVFTLKLCIRMCRTKTLFFQSIWSLVDLTILAMSYVSFVIFTHRMLLVKDFLNRIARSKRNEFISYFALFHEDFTFTIVSAFLVFIATVRFWKLIRFGKQFKILEKSITFSCGVLCVLFINQMCIFVAFALSANILFGSYSSSFKDVAESFVSVMLLSLDLHEDFDLTDLVDKRPLIGRLFYVFFMFTSLAINTIYVAIISISYASARTYYSTSFSSERIKKFLSNEFVYYKTRLKINLKRLRAGKNKKSTRNVTPKADEYRFAGCMNLSSTTIEAMKSIVKYHLIGDKMSDEDKVALMAKFYVQIHEESDDQEIFFRARDVKNESKLIHDSKFQKMETLAERLLRSYKSKHRENAEVCYKKIAAEQLARIIYYEKVLESCTKIISNIKVR